jgi:predicted nucleic acid-binding protein
VPYLIDSNCVILYLNGDPDIMSLLQRVRPDGLRISVVTYMEAFQGIERSTTTAETVAGFWAFLAVTPILPLSLPVARRCARLRETLRQRGRRVRSRDLDLIIAATALGYGLTLVTRNVQDSADVPGLAVHAAP